MVESTENGSASNCMSRSDAVTKMALRRLRIQCRGDSWSKTHMWSRMVKMGDPNFENKFQMPLIKRNEKV